MGQWWSAARQDPGSCCQRWQFRKRFCSLSSSILPLRILWKKTNSPWCCHPTGFQTTGRAGERQETEASSARAPQGETLVQACLTSSASSRRCASKPTCDPLWLALFSLPVSLDEGSGRKVVVVTASVAAWGRSRASLGGQWQQRARRHIARGGKSLLVAERSRAEQGVDGPVTPRAGIGGLWVLTRGWPRSRVFVQGIFFDQPRPASNTPPRVPQA